MLYNEDERAARLAIPLLAAAGLNHEDGGAEGFTQPAPQAAAGAQRLDDCRALHPQQRHLPLQPGLTAVLLPAFQRLDKGGRQRRRSMAAQQGQQMPRFEPLGAGAGQGGGGHAVAVI